MTSLHPESEALSKGERQILATCVAASLVVFLLMMIFGLAMRMAQGAWIEIPPNVFYEIMTAHGAGMVGTMGLGSSAVMWFFLRKYVPLHASMLAVNFVLFLLGALAILGAVFIGGHE